MIYLKEIFDINELTDDKFLTYSGDIKADYSCQNAKKVIRDYRAITKYNSLDYDMLSRSNKEVKFYNTNSTKNLRYHLLIYNKSKEFSLAKNKYLRGYFEDVGAIFTTDIVRVELQIKSPIMLNRFLFGTNDNKMHPLIELLQPKPIVSPIFTVYKLIFPDISNDSQYNTEWVETMKARGPMKFAEDIGVSLIPILCDDDINKVKLAYSQAYSSNSSLSKEKFNRLIKAIPSKKTIPDKKYKMLKNLILRRVSKLQELSTLTRQNLFDDMEHHLQTQQGSIYEHINITKPDRFFSQFIIEK